MVVFSGFLWIYAAFGWEPHGPFAGRPSSEVFQKAMVKTVEEAMERADKASGERLTGEGERKTSAGKGEA